MRKVNSISRIGTIWRHLVVELVTGLPLKPIFITIFFTIVTYFQAKSQFSGTYADHFSHTLILQADSHFFMLRRADLTFRSYSGEYKMQNDTIYLSYFWNYDSVLFVENIGTFHNRPIEIKYYYKIATWEGYTYKFQSINEWFAAYITANRRAYYYPSASYWETKLLFRKDKLYVLNAHGKINHAKYWNFSHRKKYQLHLAKILER